MVSRSIKLEVSDRLKAIRDAQGMPQREFARRLGISTANVSDMEKGKYQPRFEVLAGIAIEFNVSPAYLLLGEGEMFRADGSAPGNADPEVPVKPDRKFLNRDAVVQLLEYMEQSQLVELSILYNFRLLLLKEGDAIQTEIGESKKKNHDKNDKQ